MPHRRRLRCPRPLRVAVAASIMLAVGGLATTAPSAGAATGFAAGDLVVYRVGSGSGTLSSASAAVFLDEYSPSGSLVQSVPLPTSSTGVNKPLTASGTGTSEGLLTLSTDSRYLVATGYGTGAGTSSVASTTATAVPRTVGLVNAGDGVTTTTALTDFASANNPRGAASQDGSGVWVTGADAASGARYATTGATTSTPLVSSTYKNLRGVGIAGGQLYASADPSKAGVTVAAVGTGVPTSGTNPVTNLAFDTAPSQPYAFSFLTLGTGTKPDTLYVADPTAGGIAKYALVSGTWTRKGVVSVPNVDGVTATDVNGVAQVYATSNTTGSTTGVGGALYSITDNSGQAGTLSGTPTQLAAAGANTGFRGVAFAPGTIIGSGPGTPPVLPTIAAAHAGLPAALDDPTNPTDAVTVADDNYPAGKLTVTATSSNQSVAADSGLSVSGSGATRTLTVTPADSVGTATITLTVTAPDGQTGQTTVAYGVSADQGDSTDRYYSGAGNASAAIDVGGGYQVVGDDESDVLRLYDQTRSGPPVATFDFTSQLPYGAAEVDIEGAAEVGNTIYWTGSMSNNSKGQVAPARSTVFATTVSGSGASTTLSYAGAYTGLQTDMVNWDKSNGHGLGANYLGFDASVNGGAANHADHSFNVEGLEFAASDPNTAYFAFRAPLEPTSNRHLALVVPVTNLPALISGSASSATFGAPLFWDLGGLGVRDIRRNADGQYLIIAGTADDSNATFALDTWDGDPADPPLTGQSLPLVPGGGSQGSWEAVVATPDPLTEGASVRLLEDNGTTTWYGDGNTSKSGLQADLQKDLGRVFTYTSPPPMGTTTALTTSDGEVAAGDTVTYTATVSPTGTTPATPRGTVSFSDGQAGIGACQTQPVATDGTATCTVTYAHSGTHQIAATYSGSSSFAGSTSDPITETVDPAPTTTTLDSDNATLVTGQPVTFTATVSSADTGAAASGTVEFTADGTDLPGCGQVSVDDSGDAQCSVAGGFEPSTPTIVATYSGDADHQASTSDGLTETVDPADVSVTVAANPDQPQPGHNLDITVTVAPVSPGAGDPTGTATFTVTGPGGGQVDCVGGDTVTLSGGTATCRVPGNQVRGGGDYDATVDYSGDADFNPGTGTLDRTAAQADSTTTVTSSANPAKGGAAISFKATVQAADPSTAGTPTGTVTFMVTGQSGTTVACKSNNTVTLASGVARCYLVKGRLTAADAPYTVSAAYSGDQQFTTSTGQVDQQVKRSATRVAVTQSPATTTAAGDPVTFTATVTAVGPAATAPTGAITISVADRAGDTVTCQAADPQPQQQSCTVPAGVLTHAGSPYVVTATYAGDAAFAASSRTVRHNVR